MSAISSLNSTLQDLRAQVERLSAGEQIVCLYEARMNPDDTLVLEGGDRSYHSLARDYRGTTSHIAFIDRRYRLVSADQGLSQQITDRISQFIARVEGLRFRILDSTVATVEGERISYAYTLEWDGTPNIPWIRITHSIPNREYHQVHIINILERIAVIERELANSNASS